MKGGGDGRGPRVEEKRGVSSLITAALIFVGFIPFGEVVGDSIGPRSDDASMLIGTLDVPIVYYQEEERDIYVR